MNADIFIMILNFLIKQLKVSEHLSGKMLQNRNKLIKISGYIINEFMFGCLIKNYKENHRISV